MKKYSYLLLIFLSVYFTGCEKDETITELEEATLSVSPENLNFDENNPSNNQITIISNVSWSINVSNNALKVDKSEGGPGENKVSVTDIPAGETYMLTISTVKRNETDKTISKSIAVTRQPKGFTSETVYYDNLDKAIWSRKRKPIYRPMGRLYKCDGNGC